MIREITDDLKQEKLAQIHAILSNSAYLKSEEGLRARRKEIQEIEANFDEMIENILDPVPEVDLSTNPFFAAGERGLEKLYWDFQTIKNQAAMAA